MTLSPGARKFVTGFVDYGWPVGFVIAYFITRDTVQATWGMVAGAALALIVGYVVEKRIAPMPLVAGLIAVLFGVLTLIFHDDRFIKIKPTVTSVAFGLFLIGGMLLRKNPLKILLGKAFQMPDEGWRKLSWRYGIFFLCVAALNEFIWRTQPDASWVLFRFPGLSIIHILFGFSQVPLMMKYAKIDEPPPVPPIE
ncbi:inner membrane-spanning protein YciB [Phenylobacterium sp.]|uniref:inner membrane-spanning protein YciB n=1 Tax=Phenylobacterium sp. TaxID=1871053 RepID=UPI00286E5EC8|nr:inner membrane-spanning protein YciB [Phenylobacterium sp.]